MKWNELNWIECSTILVSHTIPRPTNKRYRERGKERIKKKESIKKAIAVIVNRILMEQCHDFMCKMLNYNTFSLSSLSLFLLFLFAVRCPFIWCESNPIWGIVHACCSAHTLDTFVRLSSESETHENVKPQTAITTIQNSVEKREEKKYNKMEKNTECKSVWMVTTTVCSQCVFTLYIIFIVVTDWMIRNAICEVKFMFVWCSFFFSVCTN